MEPPWPKTSIFVSALTAAFAVILATALTEYFTPSNIVFSSLYCVSVICCLWTNDRRILWAVAGLCVIVNFAALGFAHVGPSAQHELANRTLAGAGIAFLAIFVDR